MTTPTDVPSLLCGAASGMLGAVLFADVCFKIRLATIHWFAHTYCMFVHVHVLKEALDSNT